MHRKSIVAILVEPKQQPIPIVYSALNCTVTSRVYRDRQSHGSRYVLECTEDALNGLIFVFQDNQPLPSSLKYSTALNERVTSSTTFSTTLLFDAVLFIRNVTKADHGVYQCKAENSLGNDITDVSLTGLSTYCLSSPADLILFSFSDSRSSQPAGSDQYLSFVDIDHLDPGLRRGCASDISSSLSPFD
jgi:hypothetical protein